MIRLASSSVPHEKNLAQRALMMFHSETIMRRLTGSDPAPASTVNNVPLSSAKSSDLAGSGQEALPGGSPLPATPLDISIADWDELFHAVEARLRASVGEGLARLVPPQSQHAAGLVQAIVLECVGSLDLLHVALTHERWHRRQLEVELIDAQLNLTKALAELARRPATPDAAGPGSGGGC